MEAQGAVSVWIGSAESDAAFAEAVEISFSASGDLLGSAFSRAFDIGHFDSDFQEAQYYARGRGSVRLLLRGVSYDDQVVPAVEKLDHGVTRSDNCFVLLYNYRYSGQKTEWEGDGVQLRFIGTVEYHHRD